MAQAIEYDLTKGPIPGHFRTLAIPGALGMLFSTLYNIVDIYFAGMISTSAQAGLALGYQAFYIPLSIGFGLSAAMGALVGNALGKGDRNKARRLMAQGISFGFTASLILAIAGWWSGPAIISLVSEPDGYRDAGIRYYILLSWALPGFLLAYGCNGMLQAHGDGKSMQRALIVAFFANIVLNPLFIFGVPGIWGGIGFDGLAVSTVVSQTGVMIYMISRVMKLKKMQRARVANFMPRLEKFVEIAQQTVPTAMTMLVMFLAGFVMQFALKSFGEHAIAGFAIAIRLEQILLLPVMGVAAALLPIAAQNFGAGDYLRVREALFFCWRVGFVMTLVAGPVLWVFGPFFLAMFSDDPDVLRVGVFYLRVDSIILPVYMLLHSINAFLQALKRPVWTVYIAIYRQAFGIAFFIWLFVSVWGFNEIGVFYGVACAVITGCMIALIVVTLVARREIGGLWMNRRPGVEANR